ncbi:MAG TPA: bifunctional nuclease family protein [Candidatus Tectomicrobia bacterium]|nr:bifunctional nuclease family protein [Candidatus Tectomicrobia bacterium]
MRWSRLMAPAALSMLVLAGAPEVAEMAPAPGGGVAPRASGPQEAEVIAVLVDPRLQTPVVVLEGKRDRRRLPLAIGPMEAQGIAVPLHGATPPRPLTHDLFLTLFGRLNVALARVVITDLRDDVYYATVHLRVNGKDMTLDARPSDAIALALRARAPVLVEDHVFDKGALPDPADRTRI